MNEVLRKICKANLLKVLERLKQHTDPDVVTQATLAEGLFIDFQSLEKSDLQSGASEEVREFIDNTNYEKYRLLRSYGLSAEQLIDIAKSDRLHNLRVIRMLRLVFGLSVDEASKLVDSTNSSGGRNGFSARDRDCD
jgi:hypothetical protein